MKMMGFPLGLIYKTVGQVVSPEWRGANEMKMMGFPLGLIYKTVGHSIRTW
jgi:hypothetical protein